jgi:hypothetical protein
MRVKSKHDNSSGILEKGYWNREDYIDKMRQGAQGGSSTKKASCWNPTRRTRVCRDGKTRTLHTNPSKPGEVRVRKMVTRNGKTTASFVKP